MVIKPLLPDIAPHPGEPKLAPTLPFRRTTDFIELLKSRMKIQPQPSPANHTVKKGESLWRICEDALRADGKAPTKNAINLAVHQVASANNLRNPNNLAIGQTLDLGTVHRPQMAGNKNLAVTSEAPAVREAKANANKPTHQPPLMAAEPEKGARGGATSQARPLFTRLSNARPLVHVHPHPGHEVDASKSTPAPTVDLTALMQSILEPGSIAVDTAAATSPWKTLLAGAGRFTSGFGLRNDPFSGKPQFHQGIDIAAATGTEIYPYMPGTVKSAGWNGGHGNAVVIEHPNGLETMYAHASETLVKAGDVVMKDTPIAKVGTSGRSTGAHLHFEVRQNNKAIDPLPFVKDTSFNVAKTL
ncbi:MAG: M23 family metallopeptidase [Candidatus Hydrogenedentes bacterium]|nr:M23 family metallopeptidase [Candidatus Hydrogenedentota bacterium]